jgi:hypothetical protein
MRDLAANRRHLQFNSSPLPSFTTMNMSHGALVMEQFTTLSPRNDGLDNDADGNNDNDSEQVVHGQININTAPLHILTLAAPLNESIDNIQTLMQSIVHYRSTPADRAAMSSAGLATRPSAKGIASIGELMMLDSETADLTTITPQIHMNTDAATRMTGYTSFSAAAFKGSNVDLYPMPENVPPGVYQDTAADGPERQLARFQFLSQAFNTRSDVYTAFVRLRGYDASNFTPTGELESRSFLVVYDRSNIVSGSDMPRILGIYVYNVP